MTSREVNYEAKNDEKVSKALNTTQSQNDKRSFENRIIQTSIENISKQKVFLESNEEVHRLGKDMMKLRKLLNQTYSLIEEVKSTRVTDSRAMRQNNFLPALQDKLREIHLKASMTGLSSSALHFSQAELSKLPPWLITAPTDISRLTIEQQYHEAVAIILQSKAFYAKIRGTGSLDISSGSHLYNLFVEINGSSEHLARILRKSLNHLPPSNLWGNDEKKRRIKLLLFLDQPELAAEGFAGNQVDIIRKIYRLVEASGDNVEYITKLTKKFFYHIIESSRSFLDLFNDYQTNPKIISHLLDWSTSQISSFVEVISRQIILGVNEQTALAILQLRTSTTAIVQTNTRKSIESNVMNRLSISNTIASIYNKPSIDVGDIIASSGSNDYELEMSNNYNGPGDGRFSMDNPIRKKIPVLSKPVITNGPLSLASRCLEIIFKEVEALDNLGLQGFSIVEYLLLPEVSKFIVSLSDEITKEISAQVRQDSWYGTKPYTLVLSPPTITLSGTTFSQYDADIEIYGLGSSYQLMIASLNFFLYEVVVLLRLEGLNDPNSGTSDSTDIYTRADVCEAESASATCLFRIVVVFVMELEDVELTILNAQQIKTFQLTLKVTERCLLPSLQELLDYYGFSMIASPNSQSYHSASDIIQTLSQRLQQLLRSIDSYLDENH